MVICGRSRFSWTNFVGKAHLQPVRMGISSTMFLSLLQGLESELEGMKKENYLKRLWKKNSTQTKLLDREKAIRAELDSWHVCLPNTVLIDHLLTV